jgi:hypothetical protein
MRCKQKKFLMTKLINLLKFQISLGHFYFALSCVIFFIIAEMMGGLQLDKINEINDIFTQKSTTYFMMSLYIIIPFFLVSSIFKMFTKGKENAEKYCDTLEGTPTSMEHLLFNLEQKMVFQMENYQVMMKKGELYGRISSVFSLLIPGLSWGYVFLVAANSAEPPNLGLFGFSSMTAGGIIGVTVGITLLKHAKELQPYIDKLNDEIIHLRKLRIVCLSHKEFENSDLMMKVAEILISKKEDKNTDQEADFSKEGLMDSTIVSALGSVVGSRRHD